MGKLVVIEGLDGSGKATQTALLSQALSPQRRIKLVSFPNYNSNSSALVRMYLSGDFGTKPEDVNAYAASAFYAVDRYASYCTNWGEFYRSGGLILADRYTTSNAIHQCAKLPKAEWDAFINWLNEFEHVKLGIPKADIIFYLDVEPLISQKLLNSRYGDTDKRDIHEQDLEYLIRCHEAAHWCAKQLGWIKLDCVLGGQIKEIDIIAKELLGLFYAEGL